MPRWLTGNLSSPLDKSWADLNFGNYLYKQNTIEIRAQDQDYFDEAETGGHVYGTSRRYVKGQMRTFYVFAWLGLEVEYRPLPQDNPKTSYRKFINCTVRIALTQEQLDTGNSIEESGLTVILYY